MNYTIKEEKGAYKCAGNGCSNSGTILLKILYIKKQGYFCDLCADDLLQNELAVKQSDSLSK